MTSWPAIDFGHTPFDSAFNKGDVYGISPTVLRQAARPLRVCIAGAGGVAQAKWIPALRRLQAMGEPVTIDGIADPREDIAIKAAHLAGTRSFSDTASMLAETQTDLLLVLAADSAHASIARTAIARGIPCLIEKTLARDFTEARALVREAEESGVLLASVANKRFSPPYAVAKALVDSGALKSPPTVFTGKFTLGYPYVDLLEGGTIHLLDLVQWFMGPAIKVHARAHRDDEGRLLSAVISIAFASGAIGSLMTSAAGMSFKPWERVEVIGRNAFVVVDDQFETILYDDETGPAKSWKPTIPNTLMFDETFGGYVGLLENVFGAIRGAAALACSAREGAAAVGLIEAVRRSLVEERDIDIAAEGLAP